MKHKTSDSKIHVRKTVAGGATGALLGVAVAGPIGAIVGGAMGTLIGDAAEKGRTLQPVRTKRRTGVRKAQTQPRSKRLAKRPARTTKPKASKSMTARRKKATASPRSKKKK